MSIYIKFIFLFIFVSAVNFYGQNGTVKTYYFSGKVESRIAFVDDILEGTSFWYYENGNKKLEKNYSNGKLNGLVISYYESGLKKDEIHFFDGMKHGVLRKFYDNGGLEEVKNYQYGELISTKKINYDSIYIATREEYEAGKVKKSVDTDDFICSVEICPEPIGGVEEIQKNIIYPALARQYKLEGSVIIITTINMRGIPENIKVIKSLGLGCDEAAIDAVKKTKFIPGRNKGEMVSAEVSFKLDFKIVEAQEKPNNLLANEQNQKTEAIIDSTQKDFIICDTEVCPEPNGGITELLKKIYYPPQAKRNNITGDVILKVKIDDLGFVISTEVKKGLGYGCDEAAKSAVIKTQFKPAKIDGKNISSNIEITVPFILEEQK